MTMTAEPLPSESLLPLADYLGAVLRGLRPLPVLDLDLTTVDGTKTTADLGGHEITFGLRQSFGLGMGNLFGF